MATMVNGSKIEWGGYEYGVYLGNRVTPFADYDQAKQYAEHYGGNLKMRPVYLGDWFDAK